VDEPSVKDTIWWDNNPPLDTGCFEQLHQDMLAHMQGGEYFVQDLFGGSDPAYRLNVRMVTELAWHSLFIRTMLRRPEAAELDTFLPEFTVINCPSFKADPAKHGCRSEVVIATSFEKKLILICGTQYSGENKKSIFSLLNYLLPDQGVMPMHCSANHALDNADDG
jgi:phosphoenolpyruvate carboxykinase (ATP)